MLTNPNKESAAYLQRGPAQTRPGFPHTKGRAVVSHMQVAGLDGGSLGAPEGPQGPDHIEDANEIRARAAAEGVCRQKYFDLMAHGRLEKSL